MKESREGYIKDCDDKLFFAAFDQDKVTGFLCLKESGKDTVEIAIIGVLKEYHKKGVGRLLFEKAKEAAVNVDYSFMKVKTVTMGMYKD